MIAQRIKNNKVATLEGAQTMLERKSLAPRRNIKMWGIGTTASLCKLEEQGYLVLDLEEEGSEELKSKAPGLYAKVYEQGRKDERTQAREHAEIAAKANARMNETKKWTEEKELANKKDFKALVAEYMKEHKCGKGRAIMFVANSHPDAHKEYIRSTNEKPNKTVKEVPRNKTVFETRVDEYKEKHKCSKGTAILAVARSHPDRHKEYVAALRKR